VENPALLLEPERSGRPVTLLASPLNFREL
jgi:hypothetical protein